MNHFRRASRQWPGFSVFLAWALLVGHLQLQIHSATEIHRVCSEHGVLEHVEADGVGDATDNHEDSDSEEEHGTPCSGDCLQVAVADSAQTWSISRAVTQGQLSVPEGAVPPVRGPPLRFAPKTSPPVTV